MDLNSVKMGLKALESLLEKVDALGGPKEVLSKPDVGPVKALKDQASGSVDQVEASGDAGDLHNAADKLTALADQIVLLSRTLARGQKKLAATLKAVGDADWDQHGEELVNARDAWGEAAAESERSARFFESFAQSMEEIPEAEVAGGGERPPPSTPRDEYLERAKKETDVAAKDKDDARDLNEKLREEEIRQKIESAKRSAAAHRIASGNAEGGLTPEDEEKLKKELATSLPEYSPTVRRALADAAHIAEVARAEAQVSIAESMRRLSLDGKGTPQQPISIQLNRAPVADSPDVPLWLWIRQSTHDLAWDSYQEFMRRVLCADPSSPDCDVEHRDAVIQHDRLRLPFPDADAYRFLRTATEVFMTVNCGVWNGRARAEDLAYAGGQLGRAQTAQHIRSTWSRYMSPTSGGGAALPYLALIRAKLGDAPIVDWSQGTDFTRALAACSGILREKLENPCFIELIWSYWHEEGMLVQTLNSITRRFQNVRAPGERDPLATMEIDPLRPLNNLLWSYVQDEQHRLTVLRRAHEYDHHYGLALVGKAIPGLKAADSRTRFLEAFHNLLHVCTIFFKEDDDTTVIADGFPVLNALREVHILLTQGAHNQYGDLPWAARQEMLMQQWILARPELREFLPTRIMVGYPEPWMDRVEAMKGLMGWSNTSILHFRELGIYGERILLGVRFKPWPDEGDRNAAANWARFWRSEIQGYIHAYRAATGADLTERVDATMPSTLLRNRLAAQRVVAR